MRATTVAKSLPFEKVLLVEKVTGMSHSLVHPEIGKLDAEEELKMRVRRLASSIDLRIKVFHSLSGISKWNKIEHRIFASSKRTDEGFSHFD